jgi:hypothetical protein
VKVNVSAQKKRMGKFPWSLKKKAVREDIGVAEPTRTVTDVNLMPRFRPTFIAYTRNRQLSKRRKPAVGTKGNIQVVI